MDKYWSDTIGQRTAQEGLTWRRHAEPFAQPWDMNEYFNGYMAEGYAASECLCVTFERLVGFSVTVRFVKLAALDDVEQTPMYTDVLLLKREENNEST